ncbi:MAG: hypothetical protein ACE15D_05720 [Candidatus Eisenbacteria bacterium]|nr:hypothetical protein [Candidatus Eisenbacteria bacterium]
MRFQDEETFDPKFRLRPRHAFYILDLILIAAIFLITGRMYMNTKGVEIIASKQQEREAATLEGQRLLAQADSVVTATLSTFEQMKADSVHAVGGLLQLRSDIEAGFVRRQTLDQQVIGLSDAILSLRDQTDEAVAQSVRDSMNVASRQAEIDSLRTRADALAKQLTDTRAERDRVAANLMAARRQETYDPTGRFPEKTGLMVRRDVGSDEVDLTNLQLQQLLWEPRDGKVDVGVELGFGLGTDQAVSNKQVGLLVSRSLIHRRLGLDLSAGYSLLTEEGGTDDQSPYASASLRLSPFYKERLHLGLGARANHGEVVPFLGVQVGRR